MNSLTLTGIVLIASGTALLVLGGVLLRVWHINVEKKAKKRRKGRMQR